MFSITAKRQIIKLSNSSKNNNDKLNVSQKGDALRISFSEEAESANQLPKLGLEKKNKGMNQKAFYNKTSSSLTIK